MTPKKLVVLGVLKLALLAVAIGVVYSIYGCSTVHGVGQDISKLGNKMETSNSGTVRGMGKDIDKVGKVVQEKSD